ncbi:MAG TPA: alkaline phosphatase family protein [Gemmatimonadales bacterium]|nr:alkaline phosphatase family protein [Gemmatimonadales bacterium]
MNFRLVIIRRIVAGIAAALAIGGSLEAQAPRPVRPRLVVAIAVDQLRADYMDRFRPYFGPGGFNLFLTRGARFAQARYEHATTSTCPGHAVILTGSYGMVNGIIANDWYDVRSDRETYCAEDLGTKLVGSGAPGRSPRNLFGATVGDVLKMATGGRSKVITISAKDRSAIMLGGHLADAAYWIIDTLFVTSTYYRSDLPSWAREANASGLMSRYFGKQWERVLPAPAYAAMGPDDEPAEGDRAGLGRTFPHPIRDADAFDQSPFLNDVVAEFAKRAVGAEALGKDTVPDVLGISFSANDRVGHTFGPESHEVMDVTVRLDRTLRDLFLFLDRTVGLANTLIVLTADHGVAPMPEVLQRLHPGAAARRLEPGVIDSAARRALEARYGAAPAPGWIVYHEQPHIYLNQAALARGRIAPEEAQRVVQAAIQAVPGVSEVYTAAELQRARAEGAEWGPTRSFFPARSGDVYYRLAPYWFVDDGNTGTDHGSGWRYDQQVPLLWFGAGITPGVRQERAAVADIAPTLAAMLGLILPGGAQGRVLTEMLR